MCDSGSCTDTLRWVGGWVEWVDEHGDGRTRGTRRCVWAPHRGPALAWHTRAALPCRPPVQDVYVPAMHTELCTRKVLVMEWVDGERLRTAYSAAREAGASVDIPGVSGLRRGLRKGLQLGVMLQRGRRARLQGLTRCPCLRAPCPAAAGPDQQQQQ